MNTEKLVQFRVGGLWARAVAAAMESRLRYSMFAPTKILGASGIAPGRRALEVGCGTGFFTIAAAGMLGPAGTLVAMDILQESVDLVTRKAEAANLTNVRVIKADALETAEASESFDAVLLFGVIPAPMLPLEPLLAEVDRVLKPGGTLSVWPHVPLWMPRSILRGGRFSFSGRRSGVDNFTRLPRQPSAAAPALAAAGQVT